MCQIIKKRKRKKEANHYCREAGSNKYLTFHESSKYLVWLDSFPIDLLNSLTSYLSSMASTLANNLAYVPF